MDYYRDAAYGHGLKVLGNLRSLYFLNFYLEMTTTDDDSP